MHATYLIDLSASTAHWLTLAVLLYAVVYGLAMHQINHRHNLEG